MKKAKPPFADPDVEARFASFPEPARAGLLKLRGLIFETAGATPGVGALQETLKWGQPAYLTPETKSGSTIRLGVPRQGGFALYTHCQTTILSDFRSLFADDFVYEGNRAVYFKDSKALPAGKLRLLIRSALTYHMK
ncbi:DUF1801 domain-containing protein [Pelagibius litoralis]|uniref:DUF1801 domain-containing protein n=1 Tax=Pelagibius litoralis TaxID=374515 RepID=A0A967EZ32_9PROT|nr:DUF1801 domain-containing protein [Pelagibius litoralis]NIA70058.1 DUF1801 domain-containing protein [Pelagibius litoralis]